MGTASVIKRLLWREFREGFAIFFLCLAAPPLMFTIAAQLINPISSDNTFAILVALPASAGVPLAIALWAARKGNTRRNGSEFVRTHLPVNHLAEWFVSLFIPLLIVALLGVWYGYWSMQLSGNVGDFEPNYYGALNLTVIFALCYFISSCISSWVAIFFSMAWLISGGVISPWDLRLLRDAETVSLVIRLMIGSVFASFIYVALWQKKSVAFRQGVSLLLMIAIAVGPLLMGLDLAWLKNDENRSSSGWSGYVMSKDGGSGVSPDRYDDSPRNVTAYTYEDFATNQKIRCEFPNTAIAVDMPDHWRAYLLQYRSADDRLHVLLWDARQNTVRKITTLSVTARHLESEYHTGSFVSPDSKYMLLLLKSLWGNALDCWAVDLRTGRNEVVIPDTELLNFENIVWPQNKAILYGCDEAIEINLPAMKYKSLQLFNERSR